MTRPRVSFAGREMHLPRSRRMRIAIGIALIVAGLLGFLPILGFWMIPLGILILSVDWAFARRSRRRVTVWWGRRGSPPRRRAEP